VVTCPPQQIIFYADDPSSHRQVLQVFNNYTIPMRFRITCTDCIKYTVSYSEGLIRPHHSVNVVLHHKAVCPKNIGVSDKVRVELYSDEQCRAGGRNDLKITLLASRPVEQTPLPLPESDRFHPLEADDVSSGSLKQHPMSHDRTRNNVILKFVGLLFAFIVLYLPLEIEDYFPSFIPKPSSHQKCFACYLLDFLNLGLRDTGYG
ncbi:motile sperm domain-containing protein 3-like, partial [Uloborus diversus]|uniref:motile sperm domain-containing protein 3-like n=1 Tax=Uloborus diversus TaxID=327109 RepID=UPI00240978E0